MDSNHHKSFYPSSIHPLLVGLAQWFAPLVGQWHYRFKLEIDSESLDRLRSLRDKRLVLLPNHVCFDDPPVIFNLSGRVGLRFQYLAALELFHSAIGVWLQRLGVYSIRRGFADRTSIAYTLDLLCDPDCKLVIFAEGGCSFQNDTVMAFRPGAIQMALQALNRFHKRSEPLPDLYLLPVGIKYRYVQDMSEVIEASLQGLERTLGLEAQGTPYQRLRQIAAQRLKFWETELNLDPPHDSSLNERISGLIASILALAEETLDLEKVLNDTYRDRAYRIQEFLKDSFSHQDLQVTKSKNEQNFKLDLATKQVLNYIAIYEEYVAESPTHERFLDTLIRLERDVYRLDQPPPKGDREVFVKIGEPINLKNWFPVFLRDRTGTVEALSQQLQQQVQAQIDILNTIEM